MRRASRAAMAMVAASFVLMSTLVASADPPSTGVTRTDMVNGPVRALARVGNDIWIGGSFDQVLDPSQTVVASVSDLVALDTSGQLDTSVTFPTFTSTTGSPIVYGLSLGSNGVLYVAGTFDHVNGAARDGVVAIATSTGAVVSAFHPNAGSAKSVLAAGGSIYVGTDKLLSFQPDGSHTSGYTAPVAHTDPNIRAHTTLPAFRGLAISGNTIVAACQCDSMDDASGNGHPTKAVVEIDASTGDLLNWAPANLPASSAAFGITPIVHEAPGTTTPTIYLAAGGNDFTGAYNMTTGHQLWKEDTSGSSQGITWFDDVLIVGGHYDWTQTPTSSDCGDNQNPNTNCYLSPHLVAMDPATGDVFLQNGHPWNPGFCCAYNGVWVVLADGSTLWVGGEFTRSGTATWTYDASTKSYAMTGGVKQTYVARLDSPLPPQTLTVNVGGGGSGSVTSDPSGIDCPGSCSASFAGNSSVTLTAAADAGSSFTGWGGDCSGTGKCVVLMSSARSVTAAFSPAPPRTLTVTKAGGGSGSVTSTPAGISCGATCSAPFDHGTVVTLTAAPAGGSAFSGWSGDCSGTGSCQVTMNLNHGVTATFAKGGAACGRILFTSGRKGNGDIFSMNPDGSGVTDLTNNAAADANPTWSANCQRIAFASTRTGGRWHVFVMNADGGNVSQVTTGPGNDTQPTWAPGGARLAFVSDRAGNRELYTIGVGGSGLSRITTNTWADTQPDWSPEGNLIVFASNRFGPMDVYTIWPDGTHRTRLTEGARPSTQPAWGPSGGKIVFVSGASGSPQLWTMGAGGGGRHRLTKDGKTDAHPSWAPGGARVAYASSRSGNLEIWVINANGTGAVNVTKNAAKDWGPSWR